MRMSISKPRFRCTQWVGGGLEPTVAVDNLLAGIVAREACDARRAAYEAEDGGFDAAPFDADLAGGRLKYLFSFLLFPGK